MHPQIPASPGSVIIAAVREKQLREAAEEGQPTTIIADPTQSIAKAAGKPLPEYPPAAVPAPKRLIGDKGKLGALGGGHAFDLAPAPMAILRELIKFSLTATEISTLSEYQGKCEALIAVIHRNTVQKVAAEHYVALTTETLGADGIEAHDQSSAEKQRVARERRLSATLELEDLLESYRPVCVEILGRLLKCFHDELEIIEEQDADRAKAYGIDHSVRSEVYLAVARAIENLSVQVSSGLRNVSGEVTPRSLIGQFVEF